SARRPAGVAPLLLHSAPSGAACFALAHVVYEMAAGLWVVVARQARLPLSLFRMLPAPPQPADDDVAPERPTEPRSCCEEGAIDQPPEPRAARLSSPPRHTDW